MLNGANLNALAERDPELYGGMSYPELETRIYEWARELGCTVRCVQTNSEGEFIDIGLELVALNPSLTPPPFLSPTPFFAGECSSGAAQPLRTGNASFVFPTSEPMAGADLNGDGDFLDTVLCVTTIQ